ncbi:uncharacterized protein EDB91DRAFT_1085056 [Suillus paluster]|uniref:uncharacterized protein n=1 Tax=Suillus paluster TaxID=48578 RepID=UPI001B85F6AF|nr:uncharacterized protein EDB91DRAFT_1085056 [Suillus paluster]KAG1731513.1 hypothetical protein EDB91DRAFT_1085056 [Suillus paluster]
MNRLAPDPSLEYSSRARLLNQNTNDIEVLQKIWVVTDNTRRVHWQRLLEEDQGLEEAAVLEEERKKNPLKYIPIPNRPRPSHGTDSVLIFDSALRKQVFVLQLWSFLTIVSPLSTSLKLFLAQSRRPNSAVGQPSVSRCLQYALLACRDEQWRGWHQAIPLPDGAWDISILDDAEIAKTLDQIYRKDLRRRDDEWDQGCPHPEVVDARPLLSYAVTQSPTVTSRPAPNVLGIMFMHALSFLDRKVVFKSGKPTGFAQIRITLTRCQLIYVSCEGSPLQNPSTHPQGGPGRTYVVGADSCAWADDVVKEEELVIG